MVRLDESKQLIAETHMPIPAKPGHKARHGYEYERNGTANLFMMFAPLAGGGMSDAGLGNGTGIAAMCGEIVGKDCDRSPSAIVERSAFAQARST